MIYRTNSDARTWIASITRPRQTLTIGLDRSITRTCPRNADNSTLRSGNLIGERSINNEYAFLFITRSGDESSSREDSGSRIRVEHRRMQKSITMSPLYRLSRFRTYEPQIYYNTTRYLNVSGQSCQRWNTR